MIKNNSLNKQIEAFFSFFLFSFHAAYLPLASCSLMRKHVLNNKVFRRSHSFHGHLDGLWCAQASTWYFHHLSLLCTHVLSFSGRELNLASWYSLRKEDWDWKCLKTFLYCTQTKTPFPPFSHLSCHSLLFLQFGAEVPSASVEARIRTGPHSPDPAFRQAADGLPSSSSPASVPLWKHGGMVGSEGDLSTRIILDPLQFTWEGPHMQTMELSYLSQIACGKRHSGLGQYVHTVLGN